MAFNLSMVFKLPVLNPQDRWLCSRGFGHCPWV